VIVVGVKMRRAVIAQIIPVVRMDSADIVIVNSEVASATSHVGITVITVIVVVAPVIVTVAVASGSIPVASIAVACNRSKISVFCYVAVVTSLRAIP